MTKLSIIIPCYNEEKTISLILNKIKNLTLVGMEKEIIVVNDGSIDNTRNILNQLADQKIKVIHHEKNLGKTPTIKTGLSQATGEFCIIQDADLEYDPEDIKILLAAAQSGNLPVVYGSRRLKKQNSYSYLSYYLGANFITFLTNLIYQQKLTDVETCYKLIKTDLLKKLNLQSKNYIFENEVTAKLSNLGHKIKEVPISYYPRSKKEGKKINWRHGLEALIATLKYKFLK